MKTYYLTPSGGVLCLRKDARRVAFLRTEQNGYRKVSREDYERRLGILVRGWKDEWK
mgnify:FL=1